MPRAYVQLVPDGVGIARHVLAGPQDTLAHRLESERRTIQPVIVRPTPGP